MVCSTCGLDNAPAAVACARCNTALRSAPPAYQPPAPRYRRPPRNVLPLTAGLSVLMLAVLVAGVLVYRSGRPDPSVADPPPPATQPPETPPPAAQPTTTVIPNNADPLSQAQAVDALLDRSGRSRDKLNSAIDRVGRCGDVSGALTDMRAVGDERRAQIAETQNLDLSALSNGEAIRSALVTALRHSEAADAAYVEWAEPAAAGTCGNTAARRADYARGRSASDRAGAAKEAFLARWNAVATELGLPARTRQDI
jgi:hypothetical protein